MARWREQGSNPRSSRPLPPPRYVNATNVTDAVAVIAKTCPLATGGPGSTAATAQPLLLPDTYSGILGFRGDKDYFKFQGQANSSVRITFSLVDDYVRDVGGSRNVYYQRSNLDAEVALLDARGVALQTWTNDEGVLSGLFTAGPLPATVSCLLAQIPTPARRVRCAAAPVRAAPPTRTRA